MFKFLTNDSNKKPTNPTNKDDSKRTNFLFTFLILLETNKNHQLKTNEKYTKIKPYL
jgi:hypothetical protein